MAVSIGGVIYSVGMNTSSFEAGARKIQATEEKIRRQQKINQFETSQEAKRVTELRKRAEEMAMEISARRVRLQKRDSKEERKELEALRKEYFKQAEAYQTALNTLKSKIEANRFNLKIMKEEAEVQRKNIGEQIKLREAQIESANAQKELNKMARSGFRFTGLERVLSGLRKVKDLMYEAGENALKLKRDAEKGIINPEAWTVQNIQLAKYGQGIENAKSLLASAGSWLARMAVTGAEMVAQGKSYNQIQKENEETAKRLHDYAIRKAQHEARQLEIQKQQKEIAEYNKELANIEEEHRWEKLSTEEKIKELLRLQKLYKDEMQFYDADSVEYAKAKLDYTKSWIDIEKYYYEYKSKKDDEQKKAEAEAKKLEKQKASAQKKAEAEAKKLADEQKKILLARQEFELQFKISKLEKGNAKQQAEAQAIKNSIKRNELMQKYGYDIKTATQALKAMRELENQGKYKYSDKDVAKAKRIVERSQSGKNVGKKTLAQAQAILSGSALSFDRVAMFSDVRALPQSEMQFANLPAVSSSPVNMVGATPTLSATPTPTQQQNNADIFQQILDAITGLGEQIKEVFSE